MGTYSELIQASPPPAPPKEMEKDAGSKKRTNERSNVRTKDGSAKSKAKNKIDSAPKQPPNHDTMQPRNHDTVVSRYHDTTIETVRKAVKVLGKEAATHRFTIEEKRAHSPIWCMHINAEGSAPVRTRSPASPSISCCKITRRAGRTEF